MNNRSEVAERVDFHLAHLENMRAKFNYRPALKIENYYKELSIFDWFKDYLSVTDLKNMASFLKTAQKLGFNGYVCFKVAVPGFANGMWAHKKESTDGFSPDGACLYKGFGDSNYWDCCFDDGTWLHNIINRDDGFTLAEIKEALKKYGNEHAKACC